MSTPFNEDNDQTRARREHLEKIRELVGNVYPNKFRRTNVTQPLEGEDTITSVVRAFKSHAPQTEAGARPGPEQLEQANAELNKTVVRVSGRLAVPPRVMGKAAFVHLSDGRERLQIYVRRDEVKGVHNGDGGFIEEGWELFQLLDHGDFIGVEGYLFITKTGELSVHVRSFEFLAKALVPMPDKMHGISDPEIRQRQRYADLIAGSLKVEREEGELTPREVFERRSHIIREMRSFLDRHGYIEVETPMLTTLASGAAARPFKTHHNALGIDLYARIAPELYLKRLLVGGFERVYELNRNFRNEGIDRTHNPEFTMLEFYTAYKDLYWIMDFCEAMLRRTVQAATGGTTARYGDVEIDFGRPFERLTMKEAIVKNWPERFATIWGEPFEAGWLNDPHRVARLDKFILDQLSSFENLPQLEAEVQNSDEEFSVMFDETAIERKSESESLADALTRVLSENPEELNEVSTGNRIERLFSIVAEDNLIQPTFIYDYPKPISPLSKASPNDPAIAERFELFIAGMECANAFSELNDPEEQLQRFDEQMKQREGGDDEAMQKDLDYINALRYGMPPAAGIGIGIDRLTMLLTNRRSIRDVILFPHMRPQRQATDETDGAEEAQS